MSTNESCAACGKGSDDLKTCKACKMVKYCGRACQAADRRRHRKLCKQQASQLFENALFAPPQTPECPICFLPFPLGSGMATFQQCCGTAVCNGCIYAVAIKTRPPPCPFCRAPASRSGAEVVQRLEQRMEVGDAEAMNEIACKYLEGDSGLPQDTKKAMELFNKAATLGSMESHFNLANVYYHGMHSYEKDATKARHHYQIAAIGGNVKARHNLGCLECSVGNADRGMRHIMISAKAGDDTSLNAIGGAFRSALLSKEEFEGCLRAHKKSQDDTKSENRELAAKHSTI